MPEMTDRQKAAWPDAIAEARLYGVELRDDITAYGWSVSWEDEVRPGRGQSLSALWLDGDHAVQISMDVYGSPRVSVASLDWIHSSADEECGCDLCTAERNDEGESQ